MAGRYGRNQKRAHREALAGMQTAIAAARQRIEELGRELGEAQRRAVEAREVISDVRQALGDGYVGLPLRSLTLSYLAPRGPFYMVDRCGQRLAMERLRVEVQDTRATPWRQLDALVRLGDACTSYIISREALLEVDAHYLSLRIGQQIARELVACLKEHLGRDLPEQRIRPPHFGVGYDIDGRRPPRYPAPTYPLGKLPGD